MKIANIALLLAVVSTAQAEDKISYNSEVSSRTDAAGNVRTNESTESVNKAGTKVIKSTSETAAVSKDGTKRDTSVTELTTDPKGLGNKTWAERKTKSTEDQKGSYDRRIDSKSVDSTGTGHSKSVEKSIKKNAAGSVKSEFSEKVVNDPKGMRNKSSEEIDRTVVRDAHGSVVRDDESKIVHDRK
jgi:hypothetical protein